MINAAVRQWKRPSLYRVRTALTVNERSCLTAVPALLGCSNGLGLAKVVVDSDVSCRNCRTNLCTSCEDYCSCTWAMDSHRTPLGPKQYFEALCRSLDYPGAPTTPQLRRPQPSNQDPSLVTYVPLLLPLPHIAKILEGELALNPMPQEPIMSPHLCNIRIVYPPKPHFK